MKPKLLVTIGLPGSGKSTWAKKNQTDNTIRVNKDSLRDMLFGSVVPWDYSLEKIVDDAEMAAVVTSLKKGRDVIVDATNLTEKRQNTWKRVATENNAEYQEVDFRHVSVYDCVLRDLDREHKVGAQVILEMARKNGLMPVCPSALACVDSKPVAAIFDIDGTLAKMNGRNPHDYKSVGTDEPNWPIVELANMYINAGCKLIVCSGRPETCRQDTMDWLTRFIEQDKFTLLMRGADDKRNDSIVKSDLYHQCIEPFYNVRMVIDDRNRVVAAWRSLGLTCLQADYGDF